MTKGLKTDLSAPTENYKTTNCTLQKTSIRYKHTHTHTQSCSASDISPSYRLFRHQRLQDRHTTLGTRSETVQLHRP